MDYGLIMNHASTILFVLGVLVFSVNIVVEVLKKILAKLPTNLLATVVSVVITMLAFLIWAGKTEFQIAWYHIGGVLILGLFVAYTAMFGFDKFKQALSKIGTYK